MKLALTTLLLAVAGTLGSLFLSLGWGLKACPLCFYQRSFVMATAAVLGIGLIVDRKRAEVFCLTCLPLTTAGLGVAAFHEYLVVTNVLECPDALFGLGTAPQQSLAMFVALFAAALAGAWSRNQKRNIGLALILGVFMAWASVASSPPLPAAPQAPYDPATHPLDMCRPPFQGQ